jgi:hypothetical protein
MCGNGGVSPPLLTLALDGGEWQASIPGNEPLVPTEYETGWAPGPVWTLWRREKYYHVGNQIQAIHLVVRRHTH